MLALSLMSLLFACTKDGDQDSTSTDDTELSDTQDTETEIVAVSDLGQFCPMGCNLETCVDETSEDCESSLCLYDGRTGIDSYCTQSCDGECPAGWTCLTPEDGTGDVCMANPAECGNGIVEKGEACDDGNTQDGDLCSANCSEVTTPPSSGSFSFGSQELSGTEPVVFAYRKEQDDGTVDYTLGTFQNDTFALELNDVENATIPGPVFTNFTVVFGVCNYTGAGMATTIESLDTSAQTIQGTYTADITCFANCFDCGGDGDARTYSGAFDMKYVPRPF